MFTKKTENCASALRQAIKPKPKQVKAKEIEIVHAALQPAESLSLNDDYGRGGDPYNRTGQHTIIGPADSLSVADDHGKGGDPYNSTGQHTIIRPDKD
jgi:hypothetical protein